MNDFFSHPQNQNPIDNAKTLLYKSNPGDKEFYQAINILKQLGNNNNLEAKLILAQVYMQKGAIENATQLALEIYKPLAESYQPHAMEGLADLYLWGVGVERNPDLAFQYYKHLSSIGFVPLTTLAYLYSLGIGTKANEIEASTLILKSAAQGDTLSFMLLAERYLQGYGVVKNPNIAAAFATLGVKRDFPGAKNKFEEIINSTSTDEATINTIVEKFITCVQTFADQSEKLVQSTPPNHPDFAKKYLDLMDLTNKELNINELSFDPSVRNYEFNIRPPIEIRHKTLSERYKVITYDNLISYEECQYLIAQSQPFLKSTKDQNFINPHIEVDAFTGSSTVLTSTRPNPVSRIVHQRLAESTNQPISHFEPVSIIKYEVGDEYSAHTDAFVEDRIETHKKTGDFGGQRVSTNLIYLLPADLGGETEYVGDGLIVSGKTGMGLFHSNVLNNGKADMDSIHVGRKIEKGQKWLFRTAIRELPLYGNNKIPANET